MMTCFVAVACRLGVYFNPAVQYVHSCIAVVVLPFDGLPATRWRLTLFIFDSTPRSPPAHRVIRKSHPAIRAAVLPRIKAIVVDEVDRLVDVLSKHAPPKEVEKRKRHARPIAALLERVIHAKPDVQVTGCLF